MYQSHADVSGRKGETEELEREFPPAGLLYARCCDKYILFFNPQKTPINYFSILGIRKLG